MTDEERRDISNGIHLCTFCAREIDTDEERFPVELLRKWKEDHERLIQIRGAKMYSELQVWEKLSRLQRENQELRLENESLRELLKTKEDLANRKSQYDLEDTTGGATVWVFKGTPGRYACPNCFEKDSIQTLQDQDNVAGTFKCPACPEHFHIKPRKNYQRFATSGGNPLRNRTNV